MQALAESVHATEDFKRSISKKQMSEHRYEEENRQDQFPESEHEDESEAESGSSSFDDSFNDEDDEEEQIKAEISDTLLEMEAFLNAMRRMYSRKKKTRSRVKRKKARRSR